MIQTTWKLEKTNWNTICGFILSWNIMYSFYICYYNDKEIKGLYWFQFCDEYSKNEEKSQVAEFSMI